MAGIQSLGVGSGIDINSIISKLLEVEGQPLKRLQKVASGIQTEISAFSAVKSKLDALDSAALKLTRDSTWGKTKVTSESSDAFSVALSSTATPTDLQVEISALARRKSQSFTAPVSPATATEAGDLTVNGQTVSIVAGDTLATVAAKISSAGAGVTANVVTDLSGSRLVISSSDPGTANAFSFSGTSSFLVAGTIVSAQDLTATVNGVAVSASTNVLPEVVPGVSITAKQVTASAQAVTVEADTSAIKTEIQAFVTAYNDLIGYVRQQTAYDADTKVSGTLQGDALAVGIQGSLRNQMTGANANSGLGAFDRLSEVGIELQRDGTLAVNSAKLDDALEDLDSLSGLFRIDNTVDDTQDGVALRLSDLIDDLVGVDGGLTAKQESLRKRLQRNQDDQDRMNDRLALIEARLVRQYSALDTKVASFTSLSNYVSQQVQLMNKQSGR